MVQKAERLVTPGQGRKLATASKTCLAEELAKGGFEALSYPRDRTNGDVSLAPLDCRELGAMHPNVIRKAFLTVSLSSP